ncbi:hypothetical protein CEY16_01400 [Halalkalibacillus sediminis]|uniref:Methyl-accepting chemotaxis protein n=1 Tax=Halalkalibacillus sediminis TaxID=2018042 RepID=A0A2I0QVS3_9BACI|nr:methyl-accepting chemotaxis protein [Halalkalibacillus sediminis]PKR78441.1 hypothetical protein CEY16_01400 [Halalkalibacillus sediminis]
MKIVRKLFKGSLQRQILIPFILLILLTGAAIAGTSYYISMENSIDNSEENVSSQVTALEGSFQSLFNNVEHNVERFSQDNILRSSDMMRNDIFNRFRELQLSSPYFMNVYFGNDISGDMILYPQTSLPDDYDPRERVWYEKAVENEGEVIWTEPYEDAASGEMIVTAAQVSMGGSQPNGVFAIDLSITDLLNLSSEINIGETGYISIISTEGNYVQHPNEEMVFTSAQDRTYYSNLMSQNSGTKQYNVEGENRLISFVTNEESGWKILGTVQMDELRSQGNAIILPVLIVLGIVITLAVIIAFFFTRGITKPIKSLQDSMQKAGDGDLTVDPGIDRDDEIGSLSNNFTSMLLNVRELLNNVQNTTHHVSDSAQNVVANAEENSAASQEVSNTVQQIASGATKQAELVDNNNRSVNLLSEQINSVVAQSERIQSSSDQLLAQSESSIQAVEKLREHASSTNEMATDMKGAIEKLQERSESINAVVSTISDIAGQTNLLALNAAIEAARAGESGKGFAVVAEEVRKLAEQTENSLESVSGMVDSMQEQTNTIVHLIGETGSVIEEQSTVVDHTQDAFQQTFNTVKENSDVVRDIIGTLQTMVSQKDDLVERMGEISTVTEETAAGTEEVSASIEEMSASMEQLNQLAEDLENVSSNLQKEMNKFDI